MTAKSSSERRCFYEVLSVSRDSSPDEIRRAYKREALKHHPDRNPGNPSADAAFKEANEAYQVLSDQEKRSIYDRFGHAGLEGGIGGPGGGGVGDIFTNMQDLFSEMFAGGGGFGQRQRRGGDLRVQVRLTLREAAFGVKREITVHAPSACDDCGGSGAKSGTKPEVCAHCKGQGHVSSARGFVMFTSPCQRCGGQGSVVKSPCKSCAGQGMVQKPRTVTVSFPAGVDGGQRLRVTGQGMPGPVYSGGRGENGDLYVEIDVEDDPNFERDGTDLITRAHVSYVQAALGAEIEIPTIDEDGKATISLPAGTQPGTVLTMKGRGVPRLDGRGRGMLGVLVQVDVPKSKLSARAKELLRELEKELTRAEGKDETLDEKPDATKDAKKDAGDKAAAAAAAK